MALMAVNRNYKVALALSYGTGFFGNAAMICVATLTQSLSPDHIRGRVFGVRDLLNPLSAVLVNLIIWWLPNADQYMVATLGLAAAVLTIVAALGLRRQIISGPQATAGQNVLWRLDRAFTLVWHRFQWVDRHHVPRTGRVILAANHTTGIDPLLMQAAIPRPITWVMLRGYRFRVLEFFWRVVRPITIDEKGSQIAQLRDMLRALDQDTVLGIFPEGAAQRDSRELKEFQPGIGLLAKRGGAQIVPVWIDGTPRTRCMLWHFLRRSRSTVTFGAPYRPDPNLSHDQIAADLRLRLLALSGQTRR
jgi:1-acyl-sn-glycerol-3-phosphate acyltransferase